MYLGGFGASDGCDDPNHICKSFYFILCVNQWIRRFVNPQMDFGLSGFATRTAYGDVVVVERPGYFKAISGSLPE